MSISHTAHVTLNEPSDEIDLEAWLFEPPMPTTRPAPEATGRRRVH